MITLPAAPERERHPADIVGTIIGMVVAALVGLACSFMGLLLVMGSDSCGASSTCDDDRIATGVLFGVAAPIVLWLAALIAVIIRQAREAELVDPANRPRSLARRRGARVRHRRLGRRPDRLNRPGNAAARLRRWPGHEYRA